MPPAPAAKVPFDVSELSKPDFLHLLNTRRNSSAPGINKIPYKVYKKCPRLASYLFKIFKACKKHNVVPIYWRVAGERYIGKKDDPDPNNIRDFRPIALLNVEGKLFFSLISKRLEKHILKNNKFIDTSIQKGCMEKIPGCWEHMSLVWSALQNSTAESSDLTAIWLDIANAYGSVPHQLIFSALQRYNVPSSWIALVKVYYENIYSKCFSELSPSHWQQHFRGIFVGCTLSIILFLSAMNMIIEFALPLQYCTVNGCPPMKAFMDDLFIMSTSTQSSQELLDRTVCALSWARMLFRAPKSRSIVISSGKILHVSPFSVNGQMIPSIHEKPVKFLGRSIDFTLSDSAAVDSLIQQCHQALIAIDKSFHRGTHKLWILQHLLIPRLRWPISIYEVSPSTVLSLEQKISTYARKWLKLYKNITTICLYSDASPCPLPLKSLSSVLKSAKASNQLLLRESKDPCVKDNAPALKSGDLNVPQMVTDAENVMEFKKILGYHQTSKAGLGSFHLPDVKEKDSKPYRKWVTDTIAETDEIDDLAKAVQLSVQGQWTKWLNYVKFDLSWKTMLGTPQPLISFLLQSTFDTLPSPANLCRWHIPAENICFLCNKKICTTAHVLSACNVALAQGRFTYRHDSILNDLITAIKTFLQSYSPRPFQRHIPIKFVKAGKKVVKTKSKPQNVGLLHFAEDWKLLCDTKSSLVVPVFLAVTTLRPDIILYSIQTRVVIIIELTSPCEENFEDRHKQKVDKYFALCEAMRFNKWVVHFFAIEVGARGYCANNVRFCFRKLGFSNKVCKTLLRTVSMTSIETSFEIWKSRNSKTWNLDAEERSRSNLQNHNDICSDEHEISIQCIPSTSVKSDDKAVDLPATASSLTGLINKGNTCYANSILQCLKNLPDFIHSCTSEAKDGKLLSAFNTVMHQMSISSSPVDPSSFLKSLEVVIHNAGNKAFNFNTQQDATEILHHIIEDMSKDSPSAASSVSVAIKTTTTCNTCLLSDHIEERSSYVSVPVQRSVQLALSKYLEPMEGEGFCICCREISSNSIERCFVETNNYVIVQQKRFCNEMGIMGKDCSLVECYPQELQLSVGREDELRQSMPYELIAMINHDGSLTAGHYWSLIKDQQSTKWYNCNDRAITPVMDLKKLNSMHSYIMFYKRV